MRPRPPRFRRSHPNLTRREMEVLRTYAKLCDQREVAAALGITYETTKVHLSHAYARLGVRSALEAFRLLGWLAA